MLEATERQDGIELHDPALFSALPEGATFTETGLLLPDGLAVEDWQSLGETLGRLYRSTGWWLCDWVNYGDRSYDGTMFHQHVESCGLSVRTLRNLGWVGRQVEPSRRRDPSTSGLSISHHAEVAALPAEEQEEFLGKAETEGWTRGELRHHVREEHPERRNVHFSSETPEWYTPAYILSKTEAVLGEIALDPCADGGKSVPARRHLTKEDDGLSFEWNDTVFLNPPYGGEIRTWVKKLKDHYENGDVSAAIALVPSRTDTAWFSELRDYPRCFIRGRIRFSGHDNSAPFPSAAFYLGKDVECFVEEFSPLGDVFGRVS